MSDKKQNKSIVFLAFLSLCLCYMLPNYAQYQISPLGPQVMQEYGLDLGQLSSLFSAPMIPAVFFSLAGGLLIDRFGPKGVIGVGLVLTTAGCMMRFFCGSYLPLFIAMLLTGFTACFITAGAGKIVGDLYGPENVPARMGILMAASTGAMTIANLTTAFFSSIKAAFIVAAVFSCICTVLWFFFVRNPKSKSDNSSSGSSMSKCLKVCLSNWNVWLISLALFFIMAANVVMGSFLPTALAFRKMDGTTAGVMAACYTLGNLAGCFAAPMAIKVLKSQKKTIFLFAILSAIGVAFAWQMPGTLLIALMLFLTGTFLGGNDSHSNGISSTAREHWPGLCRNCWRGDWYDSDFRCSSDSQLCYFTHCRWKF